MFKLSAIQCAFRLRSRMQPNKHNPAAAIAIAVVLCSQFVSNWTRVAEAAAKPNIVYIMADDI